MIRRNLLAVILCLISITGINAQIIYRPTPAEWEKLVPGGSLLGDIVIRLADTFYTENATTQERLSKWEDK